MTPAAKLDQLIEEPHARTGLRARVRAGVVAHQVAVADLVYDNDSELGVSATACWRRLCWR